MSDKESWFISKLVPRPGNKVSLVLFDQEKSVIMKTVCFDELGSLFDFNAQLRRVNSALES